MNETESEESTTLSNIIESVDFKSGCSDVNGISMYYEIYGGGEPLVLIHGGGTTIQTSYGNIIPLLSKHRQVIARISLRGNRFAHFLNME